VLIDRSFWEAVLADNGMIGEAGCALFQFADDAEDAWAKRVASGLSVRRQ
jgi:hypothetical protein